MKTIHKGEPAQVVQIEQDYYIVNSAGMWWYETKQHSKFEDKTQAIAIVDSINYMQRFKKLTSF